GHEGGVTVAADADSCGHTHDRLHIEAADGGVMLLGPCFDLLAAGQAEIVDLRFLTMPTPEVQGDRGRGALVARRDRQSERLGVIRQTLTVAAGRKNYLAHLIPRDWKEKAQ